MDVFRWINSVLNEGRGLYHQVDILCPIHIVGMGSHVKGRLRAEFEGEEVVSGSPRG